MTREIQLKNGSVTLVSHEDYEHVSKYTWVTDRYGYVLRRTHVASLKGRKSARIYLHRLIINAPPGIHVDHINRDKLDNQRENLRLATTIQSRANKGSLPGSSSKFKGVSWDKQSHKWRAATKHDGRSRNLGYFDSEAAAALAYDREAQKIWGEYAYLNFPK